METPGWWAMARRIPVTLALTAVVTTLFGIELWMGAWTNQAVLYRMGAMHAGRVVEAGEWWRLLSAIFLHNGWIHFLLNTLALVQLAALTEILYGSHRLVGFFFVSGLVASLASTLFNPAWMLGGVGASGALYGLVGLIMTLALTGAERWREQLQQPLRALVWAVAFGVAIAIGETVMVDLFLGVRVIDHWAHLGGFVTGVLLGLAYPEPMAPVRPAERTLAYGALGLMSSALVLAATTGEQALNELDDDLIASMDERLDRAPNEQATAMYVAALPQFYRDMGIDDADAQFERQIADRTPGTLATAYALLYGSDEPGPSLVLAERWAELDGEDPDALNSLAWILVTHPDADARDPARAIELVDRALERLEQVDLSAQLEEASSLDRLVIWLSASDTSEEGLRRRARAAFLDTRAEALFQLDRLQEALTDQTEAVKLGEEAELGELDAMKDRLQRIQDALDS